ncbi:hypothetical protein [Bacillus sp. KH172YL63]|uniref:hypothetical protein n=1 Tax=Bacillus sp. KH172YL63 TaxID=2709784 RepID=UPI0013E4CD91|nr:hypothetical protein [Bacillus sp. KH172YL63]BCB05774.1 hypothetical protein KH172YL63_39070 [Bacillus sp. KH172YL63]
MKIIISRKLYSGLILIGFLLFMILMSAVLMGWDILYFGLMVVWWSPLFLIYASIWSILSEFLGEKFANLPRDKKILSVIFHVLGGGFAAITVVLYLEDMDMSIIDVRSFSLLFIYGCISALPFWVVDSIMAEKQNRKYAISKSQSKNSSKEP